MGQQSSTEEPARPLSRRQFLLSAGGGVAVGGVGSLLIRNTPTAEIHDSPAREVTVRTDGVPESEHPYAIWQYHYDSDGERDSLSPASPINVVFPLENATFEELTETIADAGWAESPLEYTLWAWDRESEEYQRPDWSAAETFFGLGGRLHVRVWQFEGTASMQAHVDSAVLPRHEVTSYAEASVAIERLFENAGWSIAGTVDLENSTPPDHDGQARVIRYE